MMMATDDEAMAQFDEACRQVADRSIPAGVRLGVMAEASDRLAEHMAAREKRINAETASVLGQPSGTDWRDEFRQVGQRLQDLAAGLPSSGKVQLRRRTVDGVGYLRGTDVAAWMRANGRADLAARLEGML